MPFDYFHMKEGRTGGGRVMSTSWGIRVQPAPCQEEAKTALNRHL